MSAPANDPKTDLLQIGRGFLMGGADIIPGVSGGTVALILGIYERLIEAISRVDAHFFGLVKKRQFKDAATYLDLRFLIALGLGIGIGIVSLAGTMHHLLLHQRTWTLAAFFGLIAASSWLVAKIVDRWSPAAVVALIGGAGFAFWLVGLPLLLDPPNSLLYMFFCGSVAICAMILPGISGAFILLLLGKYVEITGMIKGVIHGEISGEIILTIIVFAMGCLLGLLGFSKFLKWLLARHTNLTMATLCGFMIGSLRKLFPFQQDVTPEVTELKHKVFLNRPFNEIDVTGELLPALVVMIVAAAFVLVLSHLSNMKQQIEDVEADDTDAAQ